MARVDRRRGDVRRRPYVARHDRDNSTTWLIAAVAVETGISPLDLMELDPVMFDTIVDYLGWRAKEQKKAAKRG